jgi:hypothetical protein
MFSAQVSLWMFYAVLAYFVGFMFVVGSLFLWHIWRRKERPPEKFKLLRGPGGGTGVRANYRHSALI